MWQTKQPNNTSPGSNLPISSQERLTFLLFFDFVPTRRRFYLCGLGLDQVQWNQPLLDLQMSRKKTMKNTAFLRVCVNQIVRSLCTFRGGTLTLRTRLFPVNRQSISLSFGFSQANGPSHSRQRVLFRAASAGVRLESCQSVPLL